MALRPLVLTLFVVALTCAPHASAQIVFPPTAGPLLLRLNRDYPEPGAVVRVTLSSLTFNLSEADIAWYVDDQFLAADRGLTEVDVSLAAGGAATHIAAYAVAGGEAIGSADVYIRPAEMDLLWEADSFTPPLYRGKKLASSGSTIHAEARARLKNPDGGAIEARNIVYTWHRNGTLIHSASGRGKTSATFPSPQLFDTDTISVEVVSLDGSVGASASARIPSIDSLVVLYQDHPLFGVLYNAALHSSMTFPDTEVTFAAIPYFAPNIFGPSDRALTYAWRVNGASVPSSLARPDQLTINAENSSGRARVDLEISHLFDIVMSAGGRWDILLNAGLGGTGGDPFTPKTSL